MKVVGLTGLPASGKTTIVNHLRGKDIPVFVADDYVHHLLGEDYIIKDIQKHFPEAIEAGKINRQKLGMTVFQQKEKLEILEKILHPQVRLAEENFIAANKQDNKKVIVLEIPLLIETGADELCDIIWVATADAEVIKTRLELRGWSPGRIGSSLMRFLPHAARREHADAIILSDKSVDKMLAHVDELVEGLLA